MHKSVLIVGVVAVAFLSQSALCEADKSGAATRTVLAHLFSGKQHASASNRLTTAVNKAKISANLRHQLAVLDDDSSAEVADSSSTEPTTQPMQDVDINSQIRIDEQTFQDKSEAWMLAHEDQVRDTMKWILVGGFVFLAASCTFLFSEIRQVLLVRQIDEVKRLNKTIAEDVAQQKLNYDTQRPYLSLGSVIAMAIGILTVLLPLCFLVSSLMESMGYRYRGCEIIAILGACTISVIWTLFLFSITWCCTRPWTAALCFIIALVGQMALETMQGPAVFLWVVTSIAAAYVFFRYGKHFGVHEDLDLPSSEKKPLLPS